MKNCKKHLVTILAAIVLGISICICLLFSTIYIGPDLTYFGTPFVQKSSPSLEYVHKSQPVDLKGIIKLPEGLGIHGGFPISIYSKCDYRIQRSNSTYYLNTDCETPTFGGLMSQDNIQIFLVIINAFFWVILLYGFWLIICIVYKPKKQIFNNTSNNK